MIISLIYVHSFFFLNFMFLSDEGQPSKRYTSLSISAVHQPFHSNLYLNTAYMQCNSLIVAYWMP